MSNTVCPRCGNEDVSWSGRGPIPEDADDRPCDLICDPGTGGCGYVAPDVEFEDEARFQREWLRRLGAAGSGPRFLAVSRETHERFNATLDSIGNVGSDALVRRALDALDFLARRPWSLRLTDSQVLERLRARAERIPRKGVAPGSARADA